MRFQGVFKLSDGLVRDRLEVDLVEGNEFVGKEPV